jgi:hypothetical protein
MSKKFSESDLTESIKKDLNRSFKIVAMIFIPLSVIMELYGLYSVYNVTQTLNMPLSKSIALIITYFIFFANLNFIIYFNSIKRKKVPMLLYIVLIVFSLAANLMYVIINLDNFTNSAFLFLHITTLASVWIPFLIQKSYSWFDSSWYKT